MTSLPFFRPMPGRRFRIAAVFILLPLLWAPVSAQTWQSIDVGAVGIAGSSSESSGVITIRGSGADIWGTADGFHFLATAQTGNNAAVVRVTNPGTGHPWAKVGIMMRENLTPGSREVLVFMTPGNHIGVQARATAGGSTTLIDGGWIGSSIWLLLDRVGDAFRGYRSHNGQDWTKIGEVTVAMPPTIQVGLAVSSHNNAVLQVATVDNFMLLGAAPPLPPTNLRIAWSSASAHGLSWNAGPGQPTAFEIERAVFAEGPFTLIATTAVGQTDYEDTGLYPNAYHWYRVRAINENGASAYSPTTTGLTTADTNAMPAPTEFRSEVTNSTSIQLRWTDNSADEAGFEYWSRVQGAAEYGLQGTLPANSTSHSLGGLNPNTTYEFRLRASRNGSYSSYVYVTVSMPPPESGFWAGGDIGVVGSTGQTHVGSDGNAFTLVAGGGDMWGSADALRLHYRQWNGDGLIAARVTGLTNTDPWAKAGVMIRATFDSTSPNAAMVLTPGGNTGFQARTAPGGATTFTAGPRVSLPYWVAVSRAGNLFKGFVSPDGINWTHVGSAEIAMSGSSFMGVAASAHSSSGAQTTAVFDRISAPDVMPPPPPPMWTQQAWGGTTGGFTQAGSDVSVTARGGDIWGASDSGVFIYQEWAGDVTLRTGFNQFTPSGEWTKAGLMIRASGAANAPNAFIAVTNWHGQVFQSRTTAGAMTTSPQQNGRQAPFQWLKLVRTGNSFSGYQSLDNQVTWTLLGTATIEMPDTVQIGLAVSSHTNASTTTAGFAGITVE